MEGKDEECLDDAIRQEMEKHVEKLTMSGKAQLDENVMKQFKKICKKSNMYVRHAFHLLMTQLEKNHAEVRLSSFQMINELFNRSHEFRELLISQFQDFIELTVETDHSNPLPPPKAIAQKLKSETLKAVQQWHEKYGEAYKKLTLGYHFLRTCKKVDFNDIRSRTLAERRRSEDRERKKQALMKIRLDRVLKEMEETAPDIENSVTEVENCLDLLLPAPDNFFICGDDEDLSSETNNTEQSLSKTDSHGEIRKESAECSAPSKASSSETIPDNKDMQNRSESVKESSVDANSASELNDDSKQNSATSSSGNSENRVCDNTHQTESENRCKVENETVEEGDVEKEEDAEGSSGDESDDDFEDIAGDEGFVQSHGLGTRQYTIDIDMRDVEARVQETDDNRDIFNTVKDNICLIAIKYIPLIGQWLDILSKNGASEADIKKMIDLKNRLIHVKSKCDELKVIPGPAVTIGKKRRSSDSDDDDDFEEVPEKEGFEPNIPAHLRAEYGLEPDQESIEERKKAPEKFMARMTPQFWSISAIKSLTSGQDPTSLAANIARVKTKQTSQSTDCSESSMASTSGEISKSKPSTSRDVTPAKQVKSDAPFVPFGTDLAYWENPDKIEAPLMIKNDSFHKFWKPPECEHEKPNELDLAALKNRAFHFTGTFEPVKWKCRAPMDNGSLCQRMDRVKCPFHGKVIARDKLGRPSSLNDALEIAKQAEKEAEEKTPDWQDPELMRDIQAATGLDLRVTKGKGKGKGKGKKKKNSDLTDIEKIKNTSRSRLEKKVFNASSVRRVTSRLDAADYRRIRDKFGNQFNYSLNQT